MKGLRAKSVFLGFICLSFMIAGGACQKKSKEPPAGKAEVRILTEAGYQKILHAHRGHILVVNFFTTWCEPCRHELPHFVELSRSLKSKGVDFIGVSLDTTEKQVVAAFLGKIKIPYPVYLAAASFRNRLDIQAVPTTYFYNREGKRVLIIQGGMSKERLLEKIRGIS